MDIAVRLRVSAVTRKSCCDFWLCRITLEKNAMKHVKKISVEKNLPQPAMAVGTILTIIGTVMTGVGSVLLAIGPLITKA